MTINDILLPYQREFLAAPQHRKLWISGRQLGKSTALAVALCKGALSRKNGLSLCVSVNSRSASEIIRKCKNVAEAACKLTNGALDWTAGFDHVQFSNGSRVLSLPSTSESLRGFTASCVHEDTLILVRRQSCIIQMSIRTLRTLAMKHYILYQITNMITGKIYVGKHTAKHLADPYFGSSDEVRKDMQKHGGENFIFKVLAEMHSQEELDELERLVVDKEFCKRLDTYNKHPGGVNPIFPGSTNPMFGVESPMKGKPSPNAGRKLTLDHKANISAGLRSAYKTCPEIRKKISDGLRAFYDSHPDALKKSLWYNCQTKQIEQLSLHDSKEGKIKLTTCQTLCLQNPDELERRKAAAKAKRAASHRGMKWWNNGAQQTLARECPGEGWTRGRADNVNKGRRYSQKTLLKMSLSQQGKKTTAEAKARISAKLKGKKFTEEHKLHMTKRWREEHGRDKQICQLNSSAI